MKSLNTKRYFYKYLFFVLIYYMKDCFQLKLIDCSLDSISQVGFDSLYAKKAIDKHIFKSIKICGLTCAQANILKQTALSVGTDCAVHRDVITGQVDLSDCILSGSISHFRKIVDKLKYQPFKLSILGQQLCDLLNLTLPVMLLRGKEFDFNNKVYVMGILNATPDSFSDGGRYNNIDNALSHYSNMVDNFVDIVDIGGESTRPFSSSVDVAEEIDRVIPLIKRIRNFDNKTILSIDTRNAKTAKFAIDSGVDIINDVSALDWDRSMIDVLKNCSCPIILNHSNGTPDTMQQNIDSQCDIVDKINSYFAKKIEYLQDNGIGKERIILDPGIGFGKSFKQNIDIFKRLKELKVHGCPLLIGHSRKNVVQNILNTSDNDILDIATSFLSAELINNGVNILRVHNVKLHSQLLKIHNLF